MVLGTADFFRSLIIDPDRRLVTLSAVLFCLAYPPLPFGFLAYIALVPIIAATWGRGFKKGFTLGYLFGVIQSAVLLYWVGVGIRSYASAANLEGNPFLQIFLWWIAPIGAPIALGLIQALFVGVLFGAFAWLSQDRLRNIFVFPFVWTSMEYIRTVSEFAFPWIQLAYTQAKLVPMIQTASIWGDLGIGFWIASINLALYLAWKNRNRFKTALGITGIVLIVIFMAWIYGANTDFRAEGNKLRVAVIQANLSLKEKFSDESLQITLERHARLAQENITDSADLIIFAETSVRELLLQGSSRFFFEQMAENYNSNILVGAFDRVRRGDSYCPYNSAIQINRFGQPDFVHHKIRLVPFSEKIPYNQYFPLINEFHFGQSDFCMGDSISVFRTDKGDYAVMICFEVGFSNFNRRAVKKGAEFLVTITNDTWWGISAGPYQHAYMVPFRSVENRRWYARCANSGFSFFCDPNGRIENLGPLFKEYVAVRDIYTSEELTFFTKYGMWMPKIILLFTFLLILNRFIVKMVKSRSRI